MLRAFGCMVVFHVPKEKRGKLEASGRWGVHLGIAKDHKGWLLWDLTTQKLTVSRDVKFLESLYYKEWKQQQQKLPSTPLIVEADEVQQPSRQVEVAVSEEEMSGCEFLKQELEFLGHVVSTEGVKIDPKKIKTIQEWKPPTNIKERQRFLGFVNYVRRFIHNMVGLSAPLTDRLKDHNSRYFPHLGTRLRFTSYPASIEIPRQPSLRAFRSRQNYEDVTAQLLLAEHGRRHAQVRVLLHRLPDHEILPSASSRTTTAVGSARATLATHHNGLRDRTASRSQRKRRHPRGR
ncbi:hypothetical protein CLOP_g11601 [Closterium sp. NIES-67]|nr:hypothetical protein CLOP_g11601 [Closterium sp. NIES-67]